MRDPRASEQIRSFCAWETAAMILCVHKQRSSRVEVPRESSEAKWAYLGRNRRRSSRHPPNDVARPKLHRSAGVGNYSGGAMRSGVETTLRLRQVGSS